MFVRLLLVATVVLGGVVVAQEQPDVCSDWEVRKLEQAPDWYIEALAAPAAGKMTKISDSLARTDYVINDSVTLVHYQREVYEALNHIGRLDWFATGTLYLYGRDTVLLDSCPYGFAQLIIDDGIRIFAKETEYISEDPGGTALVSYYLPDHSKEVIRSHILGAAPQCSPGNAFYAYTDYGDLYICTWGDAGELVFRGGGGYAQETECGGRWISDIRWSADGRTLVFKYGEKYGRETELEIWEAHWPR